MLGMMEFFRESLVAVVGEMRANVIRSSFSSIIYEGHDFSCALLAGDGRLAAQSLADNPNHIFAVPYSTREILRMFKGDIGEGDIFLHNDPYTGGTHLNDILMLYPVFDNGELIFFAAVRAHWGDVGGANPGSISGSARDIFQEGIRITPTRICTRGEMNKAFLELMFNNMRNRAEREGDFNTMIGACVKADAHLKRIVKRFGINVAKSLLDELFTRTERLTRELIAGCPDGNYYAEGYIESTGFSTEPLVARLKLTISGDHLLADFYDASPQTEGPTNVGPSIIGNSAGTIVKAFLDPSTPINHGSFQPIETRAPKGTFINAVPPAACGGSVEIKALLDGLMSAAMGQACPDLMVGDLKGGGNHVYVSGPNLKGDGVFLFYEYPSGGTGASMGVDGSHAMRTYTEGDFNSIGSVEMLEFMMPLRIERSEIREGLFGDGQFRGGAGLRRDVKLLEGVGSLSVLADKNVIPPFGVGGGFSGATNSFTVIRDGETISPSSVPGKVGGYSLRRGDVVRMETAGGGGWGDPLKRNPETVLADIRLGHLKPKQAEGRFGVVIDASGGLDQMATLERREALLESRLVVQADFECDDAYDGARRVFVLSQDLAVKGSITEGCLCEVTSGKGASLRGWAQISHAADGAEDLKLGKLAAKLLNVGSDEPVTLRLIAKKQ